MFISAIEVQEIQVQFLKSFINGHIELQNWNFWNIIYDFISTDIYLKSLLFTNNKSKSNLSYFTLTVVPKFLQRSTCPDISLYIWRLDVYYDERFEVYLI